MFDKTKVITAIQTPCCDAIVALIREATLFRIFLFISQTGTFCRCEFLSDSGGDKRSEVVIAVPWVGVCLL